MPRYETTLPALPDSWSYPGAVSELNGRVTYHLRVVSSRTAVTQRGSTRDRESTDRLPVAPAVPRRGPHAERGDRDRADGPIGDGVERLGGRPGDAPIAVDGPVIATRLGYDGEVASHDAEDGRREWQYSAEGEITAPATAGGGNVYCCVDEIVVASNPRDGTVVWTGDTGGSPTISPAVYADSRVYVMYGGVTTAAAFDASSGERPWCVPFGAETTPKLTVADGRIFIRAETDDRVHAVDAGLPAYPLLKKGTFQRYTAADERTVLERREGWNWRNPSVRSCRTPGVR